MILRPRRQGLYSDTVEHFHRPDAALTVDVLQDVEGPQPTGLLDLHGNLLFRKPTPRRPIGFLHAYEETQGD